MKYTGCKQARFCGQLCQLAHWKAHKLSCKRWSANADARKMVEIGILLFCSALRICAAKEFMIIESTGRRSEGIVKGAIQTGIIRFSLYT
jgi:hypothetical protein